MGNPVNNNIENNFTHHPPFGNQVERYQRIRDTGKAFAVVILHDVPDSREKSLAMTKIEEAVMWANAGIARNEKDPTKQQTAAAA